MTARTRLLWVALALMVLTPFDLGAEVRRTGAWPHDETISLSARGVSRAEAVGRLAEQANWSLVSGDLGNETVYVDVKDQPATKVLELLLADARYVAHRDNRLVSIERESTPSGSGVSSASESSSDPDSSVTRAPSGAPSPGPAPIPPAVAFGKKGEDLLITETVRVEKDQVFRDVLVWRGSAIIEGTVTGSVAVFGGTAMLAEGAYVREDVFTIGGTVDIQNGAQVDGEVDAIFGTLRKDSQVNVNCTTCEEESQDWWTTFFHQFFERLTGASLFWLFGALLVALAFGRVERVRTEVLQRPLRCAGLGFLGFLCLFLILATLAVTLIGIPLAVLSGVIAGLSVYAGFCIVLLTVGGVLLRNRSTNPYLHLAVGCGLFFLVGWIPVAGPLICIPIVLIALGSLIASRGAGLFSRRAQPPFDAAMSAEREPSP